MTPPQFECCPGKQCCQTPSTGTGLNRRDFIKTAAAATGALSAASFALQAQVTPEALDAWNKSLLEQGQRRVYRGEELTYIAMPLGGFGAGQVYLRGDGTLNPWQVVNNFNTNANVPGSFFAVHTRTADGKAAARLLQLSGTGSAAPMKEIEFEGEYPFAWIRYLDDELPVAVRLEACSPFIPLNTKDSGLPAILLSFAMRNRTAQPVEASLLASVPNLTGWDGYRGFKDLSHVDFGGNENTLEERGGSPMLLLGAKEGTVHAFAQPTRLQTNHEDVAYAMRHCGNAKVTLAGNLPKPDAVQSGDVFYVADTNGALSPTELAALLDAVEAGARVVLTNDDQSLLAHLAKKNSTDDAEIFEDWESGSYANWTIEGDCFGTAPATGTLPNQNAISGWQGTYLVNTFMNGDGTQGKATSRAFTISRGFIHLRVGGGRHPGETCVNLVIDGEVVATATGDNTEVLRPVLWDVRAHKGKQAIIEIVDRNTGGWGHILVDHIVFSDSARSDALDAELAKRFRAALPFKFQSIRPAGDDATVAAGSSMISGAGGVSVAAAGYHRFRFFRLASGAEVLMETDSGTPLVVRGVYGKGTLVVCNGLPDTWTQGADRKAIIGNLCAAASGVAYTPMTGMAPDAPLAGTMALALLAGKGEVTACAQWDSFDALWTDFADDGRLASSSTGPSAPGRTWNGALANAFTLQPNEERIVTLALAWHFPNRWRDETYGWGPPRYQYDHRLGNQYNNWFKNAAEVAEYLAANRARLEDETHQFHATFYNSTLPRYFLDAVTANASIMRSPIYIWLEDGTVGGFEGSDRCCPMNCTHVYNYAMSTAFLLPALERNVRETDLLVQMNPEKHYIPHRTVLPLSLPRLEWEIGGPHHPALDGELGTILKTYREYRLQGDRAWLATVWERAKTLMRYVMSYHDPDGTGVIRGEQPNTYDTHLYGSNTFIGTLYLAALRAAEEMALLMGEQDTATEFRRRFELGREGYDRICWNGEYYVNVFDAPDANANTYNEGNCYGPGCHSDQLLGQWWAYILGLGYVLPEEHVRQTLKAIHQYNWRADLSSHQHQQRVFAQGTEKGLLTATWPKGGRPERPILYCDEVWTGIEYHVAASFIYEGMVQEGLQIVRGARDRYTGNQRNPWSEIECGGHYARAMSSYSLMTAAAGLLYDAESGSLTLAPRITPENYKGFFVGSKGWGSVSQQREKGRQRNAVSVRYGELTLTELTLECPPDLKGVRTRVMRRRGPVRGKVQFAEGKCTVTFSKPVHLSQGEELQVELG